MRSVRFYVNYDNPAAAVELQRLTALAERLGLAVSPDAAEVLITLGGDGTILRAAREFPDLPILGLNLGGLGYLASVEPGDFDGALRRLAQGKYRLCERTALAVTQGGAAIRALNDIVIVREMSGHAVRLDLAVDGHAATRYMADGLIFATPTGSTAYSLAAGGPVLMPDSRSLVVTPMNPHALGVRPMVTADTAQFAVLARSRGAAETPRIGVYADGELAFMLAEGEKVTIAKADRGVTLVELDGYDPYKVLARKLGWSGSNVK